MAPLAEAIEPPPP